MARAAAIVAAVRVPADPSPRELADSDLSGYPARRRTVEVHLGQLAATDASDRWDHQGKSTRAVAAVTAMFADSTADRCRHPALLRQVFAMKDDSPALPVADCLAARR